MNNEGKAFLYKKKNIFVTAKVKMVVIHAPLCYETCVVVLTVI